MFSGHTAMLTILNRFVVTYTPESWHLLHNMCAALNGAGMFFILAAHEHYTLDVLMGFYIATRTFQSYHTIANTAHTAANTSHAARSQSQPRHLHHRPPASPPAPPRPRTPWARAPAKSPTTRRHRCRAGRKSSRTRGRTRSAGRTC